MAKSFKLQKDPTFKATVEIPRVGADPLSVSFTFKSMTRRQLAKLFEGWKQQSQDLIQESEDRALAGEPFTLIEWTEKEIANQVAQLKDIVVGWGFSDEFNDENIEELVESVVSVTDVIIEQYNDAYNRARSGN